MGCNQHREVILDNFKKQIESQFEQLENKKKDDDNPLSLLTKSGVKSKKSDDDKASPFKSTSSYKPSTHIVYNKEAMKQLHDKL